MKLEGNGRSIAGAVAFPDTLINQWEGLVVYAEIAYEANEGVARILHNRPASRNAENVSLLEEMDDALTRATADDTVRVIVIGGTGDHFSSGHDVIEAQKLRPNLTVEERWAHERRYYYDYALRIWDCPKPMIAAVQGACIAGGFMVANMCDLIVAADNAFFSDPVCYTMGAAAVELLVHPWVVGNRQAKEMLFTGRRISAEEAHQWGMVNRVVPLADFQAEVNTLARHIAAAPPFALAMAKRSINRKMDMQGFRASLEAHFDLHQLSHVSETFLERKRAGRRSTIDSNRNLKL